MEASDPHFFIGRGFYSSIFWCLSKGFKNYQDSSHVNKTLISLSTLGVEESSSPNFLGRFLQRTPIWGPSGEDCLGNGGDIHPYSPQLPLESVSPPPSRGGFGSVVRPCLIAHRGASPQRTRSRERWPCHRNSPGPMAPPRGANTVARRLV